MRGEDFTTALQTLGLDTQAAAKWLGVSVRAVQRYRVSGAPGPVAGMVRLALVIDRAIDYLTDTRSTVLEANSDAEFALSLALDWRE